ncbi:hypothetical protein M011DRAFT_470480 [Sporormia fimetaria CBS 119925]|uniref:Uncharacterized protein n=1 Tax=Sporormia fimetaria CBS 119925 TaxID=1340428 RepID=A0A6A6V2U4_9PLEO|nr:hypothetical protein M011DRAFT_470480 [Sporormia fimetaria CBS 119925]
MVSTAFSLDAAVKSINEDGFVDLEDISVGELVSEMEQKGFAFLSMYGLDYCKNNILRDTRIKSILESLLRKCSLGHLLRYTAFPGHIESFRKGGPEAGLRVIVVQQWAKGSQVVYYGGSHKHDLPTVNGIRQLHETQKTALDEIGCGAIVKNFPDGGLVVRDARLYAETRTGYAFTFIFATDEVVAAWPKIKVPNSQDFRQKAIDMESPTIGVNFSFSGLTGSSE